MRAAAAVSVALFVLGCGSAGEGPEAPPNDPGSNEAPRGDPGAGDPGAGDPSAGDPGGGDSAEVPAAACRADADCVVREPCCACPRDPVALTLAEAAEMDARCRAVRCAACGVPSTVPPQRAACVAGACTLRPAAAPPAETACASDAECAVHVPCCTCPPEPRAAHVDDVESDNARCRAVGCPSCRVAYEGPRPDGARCDGARCALVFQ